MKSITTTTNIYFHFVQGSQVHDENKSWTKKLKSIPPLAMFPCELNLDHTIPNIITTSVACAIGPSVNLFPNYLNLSFEILLNFQ
jgi:hypothetical protein